jgi:hypothetical protein
MLAAVCAQINQLGGGSNRAQRGLNYLSGWRDKGDHRPVVIDVEMAIQYRDSWNCRHRPRNAFDRLALAAFTEVWYTLNEHCRL